MKLPSPLPSPSPFLLLLLLLRSPLLMLLLLQLQLLMLLLLLLLIPLLLPFHSKPNSNPRVHTGGPLQIHGSAQAVPYDLEVQIATEIMRLSLPLSLSPLLMLLLLLLQLNLPLLSLLLLLLSLLLTFHFFHTRTALASNSKSRCFAQAAAQPTAISSASNGEHALPGANSNTCLLGSPLPTRRTQKDRQSASSVCRPRPSPRAAFH